MAFPFCDYLRMLQLQNSSYRTVSNNSDILPISKSSLVDFNLKVLSITSPWNNLQRMKYVYDKDSSRTISISLTVVEFAK